jgi:hypothetical protein
MPSLSTSILVVAGSVAALAAACSALIEFPEAERESDFTTCSDGIDNDFDGLVDCPAEPDCNCNRCGEAFIEVTDELGRVCAEDCECREGDACNEAVGRCLETSEGLGAREFFASFRVPIVDNRFPRESAVGNFSGAVRAEGQQFAFTRMILEDNQLSFETQAEFGTRSALVLQTFVPFGSPLEENVVYGPLENEPQIFRMDDRLSASGRGAEPGVLRSDFAYVVRDIDDDLEVSQRLTLQSGVLRFEPLDELPEGIWSGAFEGQLRPSTAFDRARSASCSEDEVYDPDRDRCAVLEPDDAYFFLGCVLDPSGNPFSGELVYRWIPFWQEQPQRDNNTACVAQERSDGSISVRALGGTTTGIWILALEIPEFQAIDLRAFQTEDLDNEEDAVLHRLFPVPGGRAGLPSLFEIDLFDDDVVRERRVVRAQVTIDLLSRGDIQRLLAWVEVDRFEPF